MMMMMMSLMSGTMAIKDVKAKKAEIKEVLMLTAWHPSRWWDRRMSEEEKKK